MIYRSRRVTPGDRIQRIWASEQMAATLFYVSSDRYPWVVDSIDSQLTCVWFNR